MITEAQKDFLIASCVAAHAASHVFPGMAACESALESTWGTSELAVKGNNLFGQKQQLHPEYGTLSIPTREFIHHAWVTQNAEWVSFPSVDLCFQARMETLKRLSNTYPHYALALESTDPESYVEEVSLSWSTDPQRAAKCIQIYRAHIDIITDVLK